MKFSAVKQPVSFTHLFLRLTALLGVLFFPVLSSFALPLGWNKVRYHTDHHWKILETEHFEIYYYPECENLAQKAVQYAEDAFVKTSRNFDSVPKNKIPLFIYGTGLEFQETNITPELLPEGVGGFTEVFKNRIVVPMSGSYHEFDKVIQHELTHAFQYNLIYGEGWRSVNLFKAVFVPNWMMEGMAEWNAQHVDWQGEMVLRDAILNDQVIPLHLLESFEHFEQVYMAYKESESILDYVSQVYGPEKVPQLFKKMAANQQPDMAVKIVLGISMEDLYENWKFFMKSQTWSRINGMPSPDKYGEMVDEEVFKSALSPDGRTLAYFKGKDLVLWDTQTKNKNTILTRHFETQGSGLAWSPDGKSLAFCAEENGEYSLGTIEIKNHQTRVFRIPKMHVVYSPTWSPDQKHLVFSGFDYSTVDLYRYELSTGHLDRLTNDADVESWAAYADDGKSLYFLNEASSNSFVKRLELDDTGLPSGRSISVERYENGSISSFRVTKDGIYFTSNRDRKIFNLYRMDLDGESVQRLTNTFTDVLSVSCNSDSPSIFVCTYQQAKEKLYSFPRESLEKSPPPVSMGFLSNSFEEASRVIPAPPSVEKFKEVDISANAERLESEPPKENKIPTVAPAPLERLDIIESSNIVQLQWPVTAVEKDSIESFRVYRSKAVDAPFEPVGKSIGVRQGRYVDYDVDTGETYYYYVTAVNSAGESKPSPVVEVQPTFKITSRNYGFEVSPDILLFVAGYDSSFGFTGGGILELSDYLGDHRLAVLGDTIPSVRTGLEADYEFSAWRTTVDLNYFYYQNYFQLYDLQSGAVLNQYRTNESGLDLNFSYPLSMNTRFEYGLGTQRFQGNPLFLRFSEGISNYFQNSDQWNIANYYRLSFVEDQRKATQFWPSSGYAVNFTLLHALPVFDSNVSFANLLLETQVYADIGFLNHLVWANRFIAMSSQGPNPQTFFIGNDAPFQAFFTTIRGYGGPTFFGSNLGLWNTELRYPLATNMNFIPHPLSFVLMKDIELAGFADLGVVSNQIQDIPNATLLSSIGTGLRFYCFLYQRALVMLRFDVAWRLDQDLPPTFHFNLAPIF